MAKAPIYMASRSVKRLPKETVKNAIDFFVSSGNFAGSPELAVEVANYALERCWAIALEPMMSDTIIVQRKL